MLEQLERREMLSGNPPSAGNISGLSVVHGRTIADIDLVGASSDPENDFLSIEIAAEPTKGSVYWNSTTDKWDYSAYTESLGADSFTYRAFDGESYSNVATVSLTITNIAPVATNLGPLSVHHGQTLTNIDLLAAASDGDNDQLVVTIVTEPNYGSISFNWQTNKFEYYSYTEHVGADSFTYQVNDGAQDSNVATVSITVTNTAPVAANIGTLFVMEGSTLAGIDLEASASDANNDALSISIVNEPGYGSVSYNSTTGKGDYYSNSGYIGIDSFTYQANDGAQSSNVATVTIEVVWSYERYLAAVAQADQVYSSAVLDAAYDRDADIAAARSDAEAAADQAFLDREGALSAATAAHLSASAAAESSYASAVAAADQARDSAYGDAQANLTSALASALDAYDAAMATAEQAYQDALDAADAAYSDYYDPYQTARDDAYAYYQANPEDPEAEQAFLDTDAALNDAIAAATTIRDAAQADADADFEAAEAANLEEYGESVGAAGTAAVTSLDAATAAWEASESGAAGIYDSAGSAADAALADAHSGAQIAYLAALTNLEEGLAWTEADVQTVFNGQVEDALSVWQASEQVAWNSYVAALAMLSPSPPQQPRTTAPGAVEVPVVVAFNIPPRPRDPNVVANNIASLLAQIAEREATRAQAQQRLNFWNGQIANRAAVIASLINLASSNPFQAAFGIAYQVPILAEERMQQHVERVLIDAINEQLDRLNSRLFLEFMWE